MRSHHGTEHIQLDTRACEACGRCVEACREDVLGIVGFLFHKHVRVKDAGRCRGCLRCVRVCEHGAIRALRPRREARAETEPGASQGAVGESTGARTSLASSTNR